MRHIANLTMFALLLLAFINNSCVEQDSLESKTLRIQFTVLSAKNDFVNELPVGTSLILSVQNGNGADLAFLEVKEFIPSENGFTTSTLDLPYGSYTITEAFLLNDKHEVIYACPKAKSPLSFKTTLSLPVGVDKVVPNESALVLYDVRNRTPRDFGYESFKNPNRILKITVNVKGSQKPVSATAYLVTDSDTIQVYDIKAGQNQLNIPVLDGGYTYLLEIAKEGYANYSVDLNAGETNPNFYRKPLRVVLEPAFSMLSYADTYDSPNFKFDLGVITGSVFSIRWGDGSPIETSAGGEISHHYPLGANHPVVLTGDLDKITSFYSYYGQGMIDEIDFRHLSSITEVIFGLTRSPSIIDLSYNSKLYFLNMAGLVNTREIILPANHSIQYLLIEGPNLMTTSEVDALIGNLYLNCIRNNIRNGGLGWAALWYQDEGDFSIIGPPSPTALEQVRALKEQYGWTLYPDPFNPVVTVRYREDFLRFRNSLPSTFSGNEYVTPYQLDSITRDKLIKRLNDYTRLAL